ncbi:MAG: ABC transporter substrate-binding protein, partial [Chloroflexi bacterium]|nr:ABC transporter substrate-binding protein [Chloroflexota bacterium]
AFGEENLYPATASWTTRTGLLAPMYDWPIALKGMDLAPGVVEKWELAADGLSWIYNVRKGIKFHDGSSLTARDLKFTFDSALAPKSVATYLKGMVDRVEVAGDFIVRVFTKGPQPYLPNMTTLYDPSEGAVVPKDYFERSGASGFAERPVGSGPFAFARRVPGDSIQFEANLGYWGQVPAFKKLTINLMPEEGTRVAALKTGELDAIEVGFDAARALETAGYTTPALDFVIPTIHLFGAYDSRGASLPLADVRVRQALSLAINRDEIRKTFFYGKADPAFVSPLPEGTADLDTAFWRDYSDKLYRYDTAEAKRLLTAAGYPNGFTLKLYTFAMTGAPYLPKLGEITAGYWEKVGVKAQVTPVDYGVFRTMYMKSPPDPALVGSALVWRLTDNPIAPKPMTSTYAPVAGKLQLLSNAMPDLAALIDGAMTEPNTAKRRDMLAKAVKTGAETFVGLPISTAPMMSALGPNVKIPFPKPAISLSYYLGIATHGK